MEQRHSAHPPYGPHRLPGTATDGAPSTGGAGTSFVTAASRARPEGFSTGRGAAPRPGLRDDLSRVMRNVDRSQHLCLVYDTPEEQFAAAIPYIEAGIERGEKCLYIADDNSATAVAQAMRERGVAVDEAVESGALVILTKRETYLKQGAFDPDRMIVLLLDAVKAAQERGFSGLRVTGEMTWALGHEVAMERLLEYEAKLNDVFSGADVSAICQYDRSRFSTDTVVGVLHTHPKVVYGGLVYENSHYVPPHEFLNPRNPDARVQSLLDNIVEREAAESKIRALNADLERRVAERTRALSLANEELESFAYTVSHDLRAPLRGIAYFSQILEEDYRDRLDEPGQDLIRRVRSESERLTGLVNDLLDLSRIARGDLNVQDVDLSSIANSVAKDLLVGDASRVEFVAQDSSRARGDPRLLRVIFENLLGNAWKFSRNAPHPRVESGSKVVGTERAFFVRDNGAGFDMTRAERLFDPFQRLHDEADYEGTGIGLATVSRIVRRHGGRVWAEGAPGKGATFWFTLGE